MEKLKQLPIWVKWKKQEVQTPGGDGLKTTRFTKVPYQINGKMASPVNPEQWATYDAVVASNQTGYNGIGFTISKEYPLLCIDLDHVIKDGELCREDLQILVETADTYTELSPSGTGLHIILELDQHFSLITNKKSNDDGTAIEIYTENRYFTYTGTSFGPEKPVRKVDIEIAKELIRMVGYPWGKKAEIIAPTVEPESVTYTMPSATLLSKMFKAKGGTKLKKLYDGDISDYNDDGSAADAALVTALAFWTGKNAAQIEEIWLQSPLGQREKTQKRKDYRDRTIQNVLPLVSKVYTATHNTSIVKKNAPLKPTLLEEIVLDGENNSKGLPHTNMANVGKVIKADTYLAKSFRFNAFSEIIETCIETGSDWVPYENSHSVLILEYIQQTYSYFENLTKNIIDDAVTLHSLNHKVNPPVDMIKSVKWDGIPRIETWIQTVFGVPDSPLNRAIASNWLKGLVNRVCTPGCQFDTVLVLEGSQGIGKSSVLRALAEPWYAETIIDVDTKDFQLILTQNIVVEFSEGATISRSQTEMLKQKITEREDNFRRPYERLPKKFPRRCVFAMTTNQEQYLKDETGNRRWLPVALNTETKANVEWVHENKMQMFAEAYHRVYELKETTYEFPQEELEAEQFERMEEDPWVSAIVNWYFDECTDEEREDGVTTMAAFSRGLWDITRKDFTAGQSQRIASVFRNQLKLKRMQRKENKVSTWRYYATEETHTLNKNRSENLTATEMKEKAAKEARKVYGGRLIPAKDHF